MIRLLEVCGGNYLRVRGEYKLCKKLASCTRELPPRARRIRILMVYVGSDEGTTSACAENTVPSGTTVLIGRNYLRVRGEYFSWNCFSLSQSELPPRARRIPQHAFNAMGYDGTTSACAENTLNELGLL